MVTKSEIIRLLATNDRAVARALVVLNERQTMTEQSSEHTINRNGVGFTPADARMGSSMAKFYSKFGRLSDKQLAYWRKPNRRGVPRIAKYAGQLLEAAQIKASVAKMTERQPTADYGNLMEEKMVLEEVLSGYQEGAMGEGAEQDAEMERICNRLLQIQEQVEEIQRCQYKLARDFG